MTTIHRIVTIADIHIYGVYNATTVECFRTVEFVREGGRTTKETKEFVTYEEAESYVKFRATRKTTPGYKGQPVHRNLACTVC